MQFNGANLLPLPISLCRRRTKEQLLAALVEEDRSPGIHNGRKTSACAMVSNGG